MGLGVGSPDGRAGIGRLEPGDPAPELRQKAAQRGLRQLALADLGEVRLRLADRRPVQLRLQHHMADHVPGELAAPWQHPVDLEHPDPFEAAAVPGIVRHAGERPEQQRVQELLAELPVPEPVLALPVAPQRQDVDEDRARTLELDIVGAGIGQRDVVVEQLQMQVQVQERRGLEGRKRPLVGERDVADPRVLQQIARFLRRPEQSGIDLGARDQPALLGQTRQQALIADELVVRRGGRHHGAKDPLAPDEDLPRWIAERGGLGAAGDHCSGGSAGRPCAARPFGPEEKNDLTLLQ